MMAEPIVDGEVQDTRATGALAVLGEFWFYFRENRGAVIGLGFFLLICWTSFSFYCRDFFCRSFL